MSSATAPSASPSSRSLEASVDLKTLAFAAASAFALYFAFTELRGFVTEQVNSLAFRQGFDHDLSTIVLVSTSVVVISVAAVLLSVLCFHLLLRRSAASTRWRAAVGYVLGMVASTAIPSLAAVAGGLPGPVALAVSGVALTALVIFPAVLVSRIRRPWLLLPFAALLVMPLGLS